MPNTEHFLLPEMRAVSNGMSNELGHWNRLATGTRQD